MMNWYTFHILFCRLRSIETGDHPSHPLLMVFAAPAISYPSFFAWAAIWDCVQKDRLPVCLWFLRTKYHHPILQNLRRAKALVVVWEEFHHHTRSFPLKAYCPWPETGYEFWQRADNCRYKLLPGKIPSIHDPRCIPLRWDILISMHGMAHR